MTNYTARIVREIENRPGTWNYIEVGVFRVDQAAEEQIGSYLRNYPTLFSTFYPFRQAEKDYALYSPEYTVTRLLELPSCRDVGGEDPKSSGFCPVDFYVPCYVEREYVDQKGVAHRYRVNEPKPEDLLARTTKSTPLDEKTGERIVVEKPNYPETPLQYQDFGFVAGCVWGDDSSMKIQYLDLSEVENGRIKRDERFGYIAMPDHLSLRQAVCMDDYLYDPAEEDIHCITIAVQKKFDLRTGKEAE